MEREELSRMLAAGHSLRAVAQAIQRAPSTLSRELTRHRTSPTSYLAVPAHQRAQRWAHQPLKPRNILFQAALAHLPLAPARAPLVSRQIAHVLPQRFPHEPTMRISNAAIYTYLDALPSGALKRELARYLRHRHRFRRPHTVSLCSLPIQVLVSIDARPQRWRNVRCRGTGRETSSSAMPMPLRSAPFGAHHPVYRARPPEGEGRGHGAAGFRSRTAHDACAAASLPHVRSRDRNARTSALHEANEDARVLCPSTFSLVARHE